MKMYSKVGGGARYMKNDEGELCEDKGGWGGGSEIPEDERHIS